MNPFKTSALIVLLLITILTVVSFTIRSTSAHLQDQAAKANVVEDAYRANNIGVALLEQFKYKEAADAFRRALQLDPKLTLARINLGIALFNVPDLPGAQREMQAALGAVPNALQPHYILGLAAKTQNRPEDAIASFQQVLRIDPNDVGSNINLGQLYAQQRKYAEAIVVLHKALAAEPYNSTALYNLGNSLMRANQRDEGQKVIKQFQDLRQRGSGTTLGSNYLEQGRYAEAIGSTGAEPELVDQAVPGITFTDATTSVLGTTQAPADVRGKSPTMSDGSRELSPWLGGGVCLFDFDLDGDLDLFWISPSQQHLYRNDAGKFTEVTAQSGALSAKFSGSGAGAVAGDYDNDGKPDLLIVRSGGLALFHNDGGKFSDVSSAAGIPAYPYLSSSFAFADVDHDGDLDIFICGLADPAKAPKDREWGTLPDDLAAAPDMLLQNDGQGKFIDMTATAKLSSVGHATAVIPTDYNNRRDVDILLVNYGKAPELFSNMRDGSFRDVAGEVGLNVSGRWTGAAAGDLNKDGYTDFFFGRADGPGLFAVSDGREKFKTSAGPTGSEAVRSAQFLDYDNDGLLDCVTLSDKGLRIWRNVGNGWTDVSERAVDPTLLKVSTGRALASGDIDGDGDTDIVFDVPGRGLKILRNEGGNVNHSLRVNLAGKVSNRSGIGAKIEVRAGSLAQKLETYSSFPAPAPADVVFGLGKRASVDAVRVLWPAGIVQAETELAKAGGTATTAKNAAALTLSVTELDRKPSSCPYLYGWNGERFEFVTDFLGGGEMGHLDAPGIYNTPDPDEYVRIRGDLLKERNGVYELRVTNELEEALFLDHLQLISVDHPQGIEVYPNEGLTVPPQPFKLYTARQPHTPLAAVDEHGHDVLSRIARLDRSYPDDFRLHQIRGYADEHTLTLDLFSDAKRPTAHDRNSERILLFLTGWTDYAWSSDNLAASQSGKSLQLPALQLKDKGGRWKTVIENIGIPVGRPQTIVVDLTGKFLSTSREVRIVTNMRIYWDQILVDTSRDDPPVKLTRLNPSMADLRWRGFSREVSPDGRQPLGYDYDRVSFTAPWKVMTGRYTREGDVRALLLRSDDMFVVSRPGDELSLSFPADSFPPLPNGWTRTFLLFGDGFSKEMDINSASPDQIGPYPFHGMTRYPYHWPEHYPMTEERIRYLEEYNTRLVTSPVPLIESELLGGR